MFCFFKGKFFTLYDKKLFPRSFRTHPAIHSRVRHFPKQTTLGKAYFPLYRVIFERINLDEDKIDNEEYSCVKSIGRFCYFN